MKKKIFLSFFLFFVLSLSAGIFCCYRQNNPLISVVMPTYNRLDLLPRAIESVLNQTYKNFEFIIVDDGSTDDSVQLIQSYQKQDKRIKLIQNDKNRGIAYSRNRGMDAAEGKYLAIMDSDDYSAPERLQKSLRFFQKHPDYTVVNSVYFEMGKEKEGLNNWVPPKRWEIIFNFANYYTNLAMYDLSFVRQHQIRYDESLMSAEDYDFWSKIWLAGGKLGMINEPLIRLRRHRTHPKEYYKNITQIRKVVSARLLARFGISKKEAVSLSTCELMKKMMHSEKADQVVDLYVLRLTYARQCTHLELPAGTFYVKHFDFVDHFIPRSADMYIRQKTREVYQLVKKTQSQVVFLNPEGKEETYRIMLDGSLGLVEDLN